MTDHPGRGYDIVAEGDETTVVTEYIPDTQTDNGPQSEAQLEAEFIRILTSQAYEYLPITSEEDLIANLRTQLGRLNGITFSDNEWSTFYKSTIARVGDTIADKTRRIQKEEVQVLTRDDGSTKNITLIDKKNIHKNILQVINQYAVPATTSPTAPQTEAAAPGHSTPAVRYSNRYDVTILVNGFPLVHVELKRRGVHIREAFNQIERYQRESFWANSGLYEYIQIFVISNGTLTKYYSNTTRDQHLREHKPGRRKAQASHSYEFTSWWADANNTRIQDLRPFAKTFFARHTLLSILTRYCVLTANGTLLVMRPYQIAATERILQRIRISSNYKKMGRVEAGGYIWHTTGSGKTLTSFKTAQLAAQEKGIDRVIFVVDRKDLDHQTRLEYERFSPGSVNGNTSTAQLRRQLSLPVGAVLEKRGDKVIANERILVTTIQKLSRFIVSDTEHPIYDQHVVLIFDECHRSQFGMMHKIITKHFKKYHLFGFTGTPIFAENAASGGTPDLKTTEQAFGDKLHTYTIVDAIADKNVLPFRVSYINTMRAGDVHDREATAIDTRSATMAPERLEMIAQYILDNYRQQTKADKTYTHKGSQRCGFNAMFATESIPAARAYYAAFKHLQRDLPESQRLKIGMIYSFAPNEADDGVGFMPEEDFDPTHLDGDSRAGLDEAIADYNQIFGTRFDTGADNFQQYYEHLAERIRHREIDLVIVVNMFLTGFDATTLNTLFVDKNLRMHGLLQAFSRTNRILNSVKTHGNIVCFRNLEQATDEALALFGNKDARSVVLLKPFNVYYQEYVDAVSELVSTFPVDEHIVGEQAERDFVNLYSKIRRLRNILESFEQFGGDETLPEERYRDYTGRYLEVWDKFRDQKQSDAESIHDDLVFEIELIKQVEVNIDYILELLGQLGTGKDKEIQEKVFSTINASPSLRNIRDLVSAFIATMNIEGESTDQWTAFIDAKSREELDAIIQSEQLQARATEEFMKRAFQDGEISAFGQSLTKLMPPMRRFEANEGSTEKRRRVAEALTQFFRRFNGLLGG